MMKCDRYQNLLMRHFDRELTGRDQEALDRHLLSCQPCRVLKEELSGILGTLESVAPMGPDADLERLALDEIMSLPAPRRTDRDTPTKVVYGSLAGLAALLFLVLGLSFQDMGYPDFVAAARDYTYWSSALLAALQIVYGIISGLFQVDLFEASREILAAYVLAVSMLLFVALKAAFAGSAAPEACGVTGECTRKS
jgi:hypothetical protein